MFEQMTMYFAALPAFLSYFAIGGIIMLLCISIYNLLTPIDEWELIKKGDTAAAIAFSGSLLGFMIPLASAIHSAQTAIECALWGAIAVIIQLIVFVSVRLFIPSLAEQIQRGEMSAGIILASISLSVGMLNAASMTF
ncbi:Uncharacterised protein [BD1-7 clade bacterium]|uniref:Inner membrane protein YjfL n=1 Tax=BD1-7 clade bacterium TaxID=2029982 RepID=A0A5S9MNK5_9GAMM|nr:Uncharacterised protein [BD1-7 clade bacterium]CAA0085270.1 Uncharacterised protein [BD1-7 clade bacterium]CAA0114457.1 Uncharacterised protein [BD1-7 clade bacterium]